MLPHLLTDWLEDLGRAPQRPDALESYLRNLRARREWLFPIWLVGAFALLFLGLTVADRPGAFGNHLFPGELVMFGLVAAEVAWATATVSRYRDTLGLASQPQETRRAMQTLLKTGGAKRLRRKYGYEGVLVMNEAARRLLQCRELLARPVWKAKAVPEGRKAAARDASAAAETAMLRVVRLVVAQGDLAEAHTVANQLQELVDLLTRLTARQEDTASRLGDGQGSLRATLQTLREMDAAEAEVQSQRLF
jgi:hypothetical protein